MLIAFALVAAVVIGLSITEPRIPGPADDLD